MKNILSLAAGLMLSAALPSAAQQPCFMNTVQDSSGMYLTLGNGFTYLVVPGRDRVAVTQWRPLDKVQVCRGAGSLARITNLSQGKPVTITGLKQNG